MSETQPSLRAPILREFLGWYYVERPKAIVKQCGAYCGALLTIFSIPFLLKTLLSPWKAIADEYPKKGFNPTEILSTLALNMTARAIGAVIRLVTIAIGLILEITTLAIGLAYLLVWIFFPLLFAVAVFFLWRI